MARRAGGWALALGFSTGLAAAAGNGETPIRWQEWSDAAFDRARKEDRLVLLDLEAVWCHWCHVMDATTYQDPEVVGLIGARFVPVRVDQDARPDLANRYEDYGWPATVVFDGSGRELLKFQGYIAPARMRSLLRALIADPTPGPSVGRPAETPPSESAALSEELRRSLARLFVERYDSQHRGWGFTHKFLDWDSVEWALARARAGDAQAERRRTSASTLGPTPSGAIRPT